MSSMKADQRFGLVNTSFGTRGHGMKLEGVEDGGAATNEFSGEEGVFVGGGLEGAEGRLIGVRKCRERNVIVMGGMW